LKVSVLGLYGGADQGISLESVARMEEALAEGGSRSELVMAQSDESSAAPFQENSFSFPEKAQHFFFTKINDWKNCIFSQFLL
jgi:hypothetical protein